MYDSLQLRELFHLEFLRWFDRKVKAKSYALKGGTNLRFFFKSFRYSEDMDLDVRSLKVDVLKKIVMEILESRSFQDIFKPFGIETVTPPDISRAKQTKTTQRFKVHLITSAGEDLFTKVEFSRRGFKGKANIEPVSNAILRAYKLPPLLVSHYDVQSAIMQKIHALASRSVIQGRDIFDLFVLSSQYTPSEDKKSVLDKSKITKAYENIFTIGFEQFRNAVISYLSSEDQAIYNSRPLWDEIRLKVGNFIKEL